METKREWEGHERETTDEGALFIVIEYDIIPMLSFLSFSDTKEVNTAYIVFILCIYKKMGDARHGGTHVKLLLLGRICVQGLLYTYIESLRETKLYNIYLKVILG